MKKISERFMWADELLAAEKGENILEIGCGNGILSGLICARLSPGIYTGIDQSEPMISKAKKSNFNFMESGRAEFFVTSMAKSHLTKNFYHKIVSFNVNFYFKECSLELKLIREYLKEDGKIYIFHQAPFHIDLDFFNPIKSNLLKASFKVLHIELKNISPYPAICLIAVPD